MFEKSTFSNPSGSCVEVDIGPTAVLVRNSRDPQGPILVFTHPEWNAFEAGMVAGEFRLHAQA